MAARRRAVAVSSVRIVSPAKINLGLAILGKRPDGYHEIDTIMSMIDLADELTVSVTDQPGIVISGMDDVPQESNLITRAIRGWCELAEQEPGFRVDVRKCIPSPAGLGGGSSNGAATIRALDALFPNVVSREQMHALAASLGADCPFFLGSAAARATEIGTDLQPLNSLALNGVIVVPSTNVAAKTATLYGSLVAEDYGSRAVMDSIQTELESGGIPKLHNSFTRAVREIFPEMARACSMLEDLTGDCSLTGAGPGIFALTKDRSEAADWAAQLQEALDSSYEVHAFKTLHRVPNPTCPQ